MTLINLINNPTIRVIRINSCIGVIFCGFILTKNKNTVKKPYATEYYSVDRGVPQRPRRNTWWHKVFKIFLHFF